MAKNGQKLENIRHTLAHLLAAAVLELWPGTRRAIGPTIEHGFYYDFEFPRPSEASGGGGSKPISEKDLPKIEEKMRQILVGWKSVEGREVTTEEAKVFFKNEPYKLEMVDEAVGKGEKLTVYKTGNYEDFCRGGHSLNPSKEIRPDSFKLDRVAGAYWRGNEKNKMLTRIYGLAFTSKKELDEFLKLREAAAERDHRRLGRELDLFTFSDLVGAGLPLFTPRGALMRELITEKVSKLQEKFGYQKVTIPHLAKRELYETSGHWEKFKDALFHVKGATDTEFVIKPMNCPHHTQIYASRTRSYRDLPIRFAETTMVYRDEQAGELLGLTRVRSITQDDAHIFCRPDQIKQEVKNIITVTREFYRSLGMFEKDGFGVMLSTRDPKQAQKYLGTEAKWKEAEQALAEAATDADLSFEELPGEAAFYGPKLDFLFRDALGREWQLTTIQLDFNMPERFGLTYADKDNKEKTPVMIHRAITGSLERFMAVMIEHFAGAFPVWLAPVQVLVLPITDTQKKYAEEIFEESRAAGVRAEIDASNETLNKKIRGGKLQKIPYLLVIGEKEMKKKKVMVESRDSGQLGLMKLPKFIALLQKETN